MTKKALIVVDVQNDFCEGGSLAVEGGSAVAAAVTRYIREHRDEYSLVIASADDHMANSTNTGHIALPPDEPDYTNTWPVHCITGTHGAEFHPALDMELVDVIVRKGRGVPAYSAFEARDSGQHSLNRLLADRNITEVDIVGIATDYCVDRTVHDARHNGLTVNVLLPLTAAVHPENTAEVTRAFTAHGANVLEEVTA